VSSTAASLAVGTEIVPQAILLSDKIINVVAVILLYRMIVPIYGYFTIRASSLYPAQLG